MTKIIRIDGRKVYEVYELDNEGRVFFDLDLNRFLDEKQSNNLNLDHRLVDDEEKQPLQEEDNQC